MNLDIEYFNFIIMSISSRNIADKFGRKPATSKQKPTVISFKQTTIRHYATNNHKHIEQYKHRAAEKRLGRSGRIDDPSARLNLSGFVEHAALFASPLRVLSQTTRACQVDSVDL